MNKIGRSNWKVKAILSVGILCYLFIGGAVLAEIPEINIYGLMDYKELKRVIEKNEEILKKNPSDVNVLKTLGIAYHNLSVIGKKGVCQKAFSILTKAYELAPHDYEILVYLGSTHTLLGRDATLPLTRVYQVIKGCRIMDKAVSKVPDNIIVRLTRAHNSLALPSFFKRAKYAEEDLLYLLKLSKKAPEKFPPDLLATIYYNLGEYYKGNGKSQWNKARDYWKQAVEVAPESEDGIAAQKRLEVYKP
ncbi:MAG: tetratricopeptide repeat protein [bacterium]|nr:tetratricopeptide repeat protein [bacterium]